MVGKLKPTEADDPAYKFTVGMSGYLDDPYLPGGPYVTHLRVRIAQEWYDEATDGGVERRVGRIEGFIFNVGLAVNDGKCVVSAAEEIDAEVAEHCGAVIDRDMNDWRPEVRQQFNVGEAPEGVLAITGMKIKPGHRGRRLGHLAMLRMMHFFGGHLGFTVIKPVPFEHPAEALKGPGWSGDGWAVAKREKGTEKLRRYWGRLGFQRMGTTDFSGLSGRVPLPTLDSILTDAGTDQT